MGNSIENIRNQLIEDFVIRHFTAEGLISAAHKYLERPDGTTLFSHTGRIAEGNIELTINRPDGETSQYSQIDITTDLDYSFEGLAFLKKNNKPDEPGTVKIFFTGVDDKSSPNVRSAVFLKYVGSQLERAKEWLDEKVIPEIPEGARISLGAHCFGAHAGMWATAYLRRQGYEVKTTLIEAMYPGLMFEKVSRELARINKTTPIAEAEKLAENITTVIGSPDTIINIWPAGSQWHAAPVGKESYIIDFPHRTFRGDIKDKLIQSSKDVAKAIKTRQWKGIKRVVKKLERVPFVDDHNIVGLGKRLLENPESLRQGPVPNPRATVGRRVLPMEDSSVISLKALNSYVTMLIDLIQSALGGHSKMNFTERVRNEEPGTNKSR